MGDRRKSNSKDGPEAREPVIENRKARFDFAIGETLECGLKLVGTEVKSLRKGQASIAEGWILASVEPPELTLLNVTIAEYPPAGASRQHVPNRPRRLLAHGKEIVKLATEAKAKEGRAKVLIGIGLGKKQHDKRESIAKREDKRDMDRAVRRKA